MNGNKTSMKICITTGGTGGHIYPALALVEIWKQKDPSLEVFFIGNEDRMESEIIPEKGYPFYGLKAKGFVGNIKDKLNAIFLMVKAKSQAKKILLEKNPDLVIGFGGYVTAPVLMAAKSVGIPTMVHEQNSIVGKSNKIAMKNADAIVTCYEEVSKQIQNPNIYQLGNPRATLVSMSQPDLDYFKSLGLQENKKTIMVVMGSLGSSSVNELMKEALKDLDPSLQVLYVCGKDNDQNLDLFPEMENVITVPYANTMALYGFLDGMICRAGATTLAEVTALGIPTILVPSPYVANNHQYYNARFLKDKSCAEMIEEKDLNALILKEKIELAFLNKDKAKSLSEQAKVFGKPNAAWDMIDLACQIVENKK